MRRSVGVAALAAAISAGAPSCGSRGGGADRAGDVGRAAGAAIGAAVEAAAAVTAPWRCARLDDPVSVTPPPGWTLTGAWLRGDGARVLVVGEARGAGERTVAALAALRRQLDEEPVDVVVSLGGMGATQAEIVRALAPLARGARWLVVAVPGDREAVPAHRAAIAELAAAGAPVVDGSQVRLIELPGAVIAMLPGAPHAPRLGAGDDGCAHDDADVAALLGALAGAPADPGKAGAARAPATILVTQRAPRGPTDLAPGGIHAGDLELGAALAAHPVDLVVHGAVDDVTGGPGAVRHAAANPGGRVAVGAIDATPRYRANGARVLPSALRVTIGERDLAWKPITPAVVP